MAAIRPSRFNAARALTLVDKRRAWIRRMQLIERDAIDAERLAASFARRPQVLRASIRFPAAFGPSHAAFGGDGDPRSITRPGRQRARDQPLVVSDVAIVEAVRIGGVEQRDAGIERGVQDLDRAIVITIGIGRQPHAADRDGPGIVHRAVIVWSACRLYTV